MKIVRVLLAWAVVALPLGYGVALTLVNAAELFR